MENTEKSLFERVLDRAVRAIQNRHEPQGLMYRILQWMRRLAAVFTWGYVAGLGLLLAGLEWQAEKNWLLSFCLFVPAQTWLLPLAGITPFCLLFRWRLCLAHLGCVVFMLVFYMDYEWSSQPAAKGRTVTILSNNIGESNRQSMRPFVESEQPDILVLQDAYGRGPAYQQTYSNRFVVAQGQFVIVSKWPVKNSGPVPVTVEDNAAVAAWFELDCDGKPLMVYNVHLPSPRNNLESMKGIGFLAALAGREGRFGSKLRKDNQHFWDRQMELARGVAEVVKRDTRPSIIAGDFNVPSHGWIYHHFAGQFTDAFEKRGRGYGFTFPGTTRNPLTLFGPWLRLDQIYCNAALAPVYAKAEPDRKSQHRSVVARFEWAE